MRNKVYSLLLVGAGIAILIASTILFNASVDGTNQADSHTALSEKEVPAAALAGATLLVIADSLARIVVIPAELPTGILTALLGAPFFVALLLQQRKDV